MGAFKNIRTSFKNPQMRLGIAKILAGITEASGPEGGTQNRLGAQLGDIINGQLLAESTSRAADRQQDQINRQLPGSRATTSLFGPQNPANGRPQQDFRPGVNVPSGLPPVTLPNGQPTPSFGTGVLQPDGTVASSAPQTTIPRLSAKDVGMLGESGTREALEAIQSDNVRIQRERSVQDAIKSRIDLEELRQRNRERQTIFDANVDIATDEATGVTAKRKADTAKTTAETANLPSPEDARQKRKLADDLTTARTGQANRSSTGRTARPVDTANDILERAVKRRGQDGLTGSGESLSLGRRELKLAKQSGELPTGFDIEELLAINFPEENKELLDAHFEKAATAKRPPAAPTSPEARLSFLEDLPVGAIVEIDGQLVRKEGSKFVGIGKNEFVNELARRSVAKDDS